MTVNRDSSKATRCSQQWAVAPETVVEQVGRYRRPSVCPQGSPWLCRRHPHILAWLLGDGGPQRSSQAHLSMPSRCPRLGVGHLDKTSCPSPLSAGGRGMAKICLGPSSPQPEEEAAS